MREARSDMRKRALIPVLVLVALFSVAFPAAAQSEAEEKAFREIKLLIFDESWADALSRLEAFLAGKPADSRLAPALYYRAKCLEEIGGREEEALQAYKEYLGRGDRNRSLSQDAEASIIDLAMKLYQNGDRSYLPEVEERLAHPEKEVRYFAAVRLSSVKEKKAAAKSIPVLKAMLAEPDEELSNRAKLGLLRVDPEALAAVPDRHADRSSSRRSERKPKIFHIQILEALGGKAVLSLNLPFALADLALSGISMSDRALLKERGYDIDRIIRDLQTDGTILEIRDEKEGKVIKIWID